MDMESIVCVSLHSGNPATHRWQHFIYKATGAPFEHLPSWRCSNSSAARSRPTATTILAQETARLSLLPGCMAYTHRVLSESSIGTMRRAAQWQLCERRPQHNPGPRARCSACSTPRSSTWTGATLTSSSSPPGHSAMPRWPDWRSARADCGREPRLSLGAQD